MSHLNILISVILFLVTTPFLMNYGNKYYDATKSQKFVDKWCDKLMLPQIWLMCLVSLFIIVPMCLTDEFHPVRTPIEDVSVVKTADKIVAVTQHHGTFEFKEVKDMDVLVAKRFYIVESVDSFGMKNKPKLAWE